MQADNQYLSFLGGEVSPRLYNRADLDKYGKWFANAENISFKTQGAFSNRCGFAKVANTKNNIKGETIKLLTFQYNNEEAFLIELGVTDGVGYARFFKDGEPIMSGANPYEIESPFVTLTQDDLKYTQSGDIMFITNKTDGIWELRRLNIAGTSWEFKKFGTDILPLEEQNTEKLYTLTLANRAVDDTRQIVFEDPQNNGVVKNFVLYFDNVATVTLAEERTFADLFTDLASALSGQNITVSNSGLTMNLVYLNGWDDLNVSEVSVSYDIKDIYTSEHTKTEYANYYSQGYAGSDLTQSQTLSIPIIDGTKITSVTTKVTSGSDGFWSYHWGARSWEDSVIKDTTITIPSNLTTTEQELQNIVSNDSDFSYSSGYILAHSYTAIFPTSNRVTFQTRVTTTVTLYIEDYVSKTIVATGQSAGIVFTCTASGHNFFANKQAGEVFSIENTVKSNELQKTQGVGTDTSSSVISNGKWRYYTMGNWTGTLTIQYSSDNGATWSDYMITRSFSDSVPKNENTSGVITTDDTILFRVVANVTSGSVSYVFTTDSYTVNSYYKIIQILSSTTAVVQAIKNDVGEVSATYKWRESAFSKSKGYPQTVGFYQNRLFFGKGYILYGSKSNDFWDFYEPITVKDDNPITMSLLSYQVNNIQNILTLRDFFAFTGGGEFGLGGTGGTLTQASKFMKPLSAHGSAQCSPVTTGSTVLFVDSSGNTVRGMQYTLESDGYEAHDMSVFIDQLLEGKTIISTAYNANEKESYFLTNDGTIYVFKYYPEQEIFAWSHWEHALYKITNITVVPRGYEKDLYIALDTDEGKKIERLVKGNHLDSMMQYSNETPFNTVTTEFAPGQEIWVKYNNYTHKAFVNPDRTVDLRESTNLVIFGIAPVADATLLKPVIQTQEGVFSTYFTSKPFKVHFIYRDSYGFEVGEQQEEKFEIKWQDTATSAIDDQQQLTTGTKSVLINSRFDGNGRVSFVQEKPFPMEVENVLIEMDFGGK